MFTEDGYYLPIYKNSSCIPDKVKRLLFLSRIGGDFKKVPPEYIDKIKNNTFEDQDFNIYNDENE